MNVIIHGNEIHSERDFHKNLSEAFEFSAYYGKNLDALWDYLSTEVERPLSLIWKDSELSQRFMGDDFDKIATLLERVVKQDIKWELDDKFEVHFD
ncbi:barstar family protein [Enterovibrio makurazakiensis]|uniref:barstar family protein n=1 Tax=Enterovibrio makurazakiensis TaxID=2910232 RepID=UPI003D211026